MPFTFDELSSKVIVTSESQVSEASAEPPVLVGSLKLTSHSTVISEGSVVKVGEDVSVTDTIAVPKLIFPLSSRAMSVTVFDPKSSQSNVLTSMNINGEGSQLSFVPLSISDESIAAELLESNVTVISCVIIEGPISSTTVTTAVAVEEFPLSSSTVRVTVTGLPTSSQSNVLWSIVKVGELSQLSLDESSTSEAVIVAAPLAPSATVISCANAVGAGYIHRYRQRFHPYAFSA